MRYFTRGWTVGELPDEEADEVPRRYAARLDEIRPRLSAPLVRLSQISLHDGLIEGVVWKPKSKQLWMSVVAGDLQVGYFTATLVYSNALLGDRNVEARRRAALSRETELLYDEVDIDPDGELTHRLLFWPREELSIVFAELELTIEPRESRDVLLPGAFTEDDED